MQTKDALRLYGFSDKESEIYLAGLELGSATANAISGKARINRSTTYDILKAFLELGIASKIIKDRTTHFEMALPRKLIAILEEKKEALQGVMDQLELVRTRVVTKPVVEMYEGKEGLKTILENILETGEQTDVISTSKVFEVLRFAFPHYIKKRKEKNIPARVIQEQSAQTTTLKQHDAAELRETRALENYAPQSATFLAGDLVATITLVEKEPIGILIQDAVIAKDQKAIFELLWGKAK